MSKREIAVKTFGWPEQEEFAHFSGDINPIHMSALAARRTQAGRPVIHGVNAVLWGLDELARHGFLQSSIAACKVQFRKLMYVGDPVSVWIAREPVGRLHAELRVGTTTTVTILLTWGLPIADEGTDESSIASTPERRGDDLPQEWRLEELDGIFGSLFIRDQSSGLYPDLMKILGARRTASLVHLSTVVGMRVPGLHSIFTAFHLQFPANADSTHLTYRVEEVDDRFRLITLHASGGGVAGSVTAIARVPPVQQAKITELARLTLPGEFRNTRALVIGGSRGLGELAAKMIVAGGGQVTITYAVGEADAIAVQNEIRDWGGACETMRFDATLPVADQVQSITEKPTSLYYFATSPIFGRADAIYSRAVFANFCRFYVDAFYEACLTLMESGRELGVLYPSSVAVLERPEGMTEYSMAKMAGETLCADMNHSLPGIRIVVARLPRLLTDQTATATPVDTENPVNVLLPQVRRVERSEDCVHEGIPVSTH